VFDLMGKKGVFISDVVSSDISIFTIGDSNIRAIKNYGMAELSHLELSATGYVLACQLTPNANYTALAND